ncbi:MAG: helix-turn-helix domain-containing protein [Bacteroidota bacterium]
MNNIRNEKLLKKFGLHLKELREKKGFSQESLANEADVPISQIGRIERGEVNPTLSTLDTLATALKMTLKELMNF